MITASSIKDYALNQIGVDLIGITKASPSKEGKAHLENFITEQRHGDMSYLENSELRTNPESILPGAKSVIVIGINYYREKPETPPDQGRIARYAYGRDYHKVIKKTLKQLIQHLESEQPDSQNRACVDSAPLLEKDYAIKAGLGFIGKNTTLINPNKGSFLLLGEILTTLDLESDQNKAGTCGSCTRCLDACPTNALTEPFKMDARRCISYLTIEHQGEIEPDLANKMGNLIFGCDICQEVCPYNQAFAKPLKFEPLKAVKIAGDSISLDEILAIKDDEEYLQKFAGSPLMRAKRKGLQRNARIAKHNS